MIRVQAEHFDPGAELAALAAAGAGAGGLASFVGLVRGRAGRGEEVAALELTHYPGFTERTIAAIGDAARRRFALAGLRVVHRHGLLAPGEPIVFVGAAAAHRRAALEAVDYLMDRLKTEAPFWKREHGPSGARWVEPRATDHADRARWGEE